VNLNVYENSNSSWPLELGSTSDIHWPDEPGPVWSSLCW